MVCVALNAGGKRLFFSKENQSAKKGATGTVLQGALVVTKLQEGRFAPPESLHDRRDNRLYCENAFQRSEPVQEAANPVGIAIYRYQFQAMSIVDMDMCRAKDNVQKIMLQLVQILGCIVPVVIE